MSSSTSTAKDDQQPNQQLRKDGMVEDLPKKHSCTSVDTRKKMKLLHYLQTNGYVNSNKKAKKLIRDNRVIVNGSSASSCSMMVSANKDDGQVEVLPVLEKNQNSIIEIHSEDCGDGSSTSKNGNNSNVSIIGGHVENQKETRALTSFDSLGTKEHQEKKKGMIPVPFCIVIHKPCGMICTTASKESLKKQQQQKHGLQEAKPSLNSDRFDFETLSDLEIPSGFHPVGRLDRHSHGLLLFSSDGRLTSALLSPRTSISRVYEIVVRGDVGRKNGGGRYEDIKQRVESGVQTDYGFFKGKVLEMERDVGEYGYAHEKCKDDSGAKRNDKYGLSPEEFEKYKMTKSYTEKLGNENQILSLIRVVVNEGKKRMVRRLFAALDLFVLDLKRIKYGDIDIGELTPGSWRYLSDEELHFCKGVISKWDKDGAGWNKRKSSEC